ncbi:MAG: M15 family metallopeptidase [Lachnospiraceae bacterium]|nr:M15 family metallopeptidase [Lachnospiraceae bacterium]
MIRCFRGFPLILAAALILSACGEKGGEGTVTGKSDRTESEEVIVIGEAEDLKEAETVKEAEGSGTEEPEEEAVQASGETETDEEALETEETAGAEENKEETEEKPEEETKEEDPEEIEEEKPEEQENPEVAEQQDTDAAADTGFSKSEISDEIKARINGRSYAAGCTVPYEDLRYLKVMYVNFNGDDCSGEIICNKAIADDLLSIFEELYRERYQIDKIRLIDEYGADDDLSCADDNTSCFCFRNVEGSGNLSKHALGLAIDINPFYNPYVTYPNGKIRISPPGSEPYADRDSDFPHKIDKNDPAYKLFKAHGFTWGGDWKTLKDYQHFQKTF